MSVHVLAPAAVKTFRLRIAEHPRVLQASVKFEAYGNVPMRGLLFRFYQPDGTLAHEVRPPQGWPYGTGTLCRLRKRSLALRMEHLIRNLMRHRRFFHLDVPAACLVHPELSMSVQNVSGGALAVGEPRLSTSTLAPGRRVRNAHAIEGYSDRISVRPGEPLQLFVHAPLGRFALAVTRRGASDRLMLQVDAIDGMPQDYAADAYERGALWEPTCALQVGADWPGGMYSARLYDASGATFDMTFIVTKSRSAASAGLAVLASTNTWLAYNDWGGASLYRYDVGDGLDKVESTRVHMRRPNPAATTVGDTGHLANAELHVLRWLEHNWFAYDLYADIDLHQDPGLLLRYHTLLVNTHSEYWTEAMYAGLEQFLDAGGNLIYLSGNGLYWKAEIDGQQLEVKRDNTSHTASGESGGKWRDCGRPEARLLGVRYTWAGLKLSYMPYKVLAPGHWIFNGTGVTKGSLVGRAGLNRGGASGWEMDTIDRRNKPAGLVRLAKGTNRWGCGADMTYFTHAGGGGVFSVGSITFGGSLAIDPILGRMLRNVLARFSESDSVPPYRAARADAGAQREPLPE